MEKAIQRFMVLIAILFLFSVLQVSASCAAEKKVKFQIEDVTCLSIAYTAESIPQKLAGVQSSKFDFAEDGVIVVFDDSRLSIGDIVNSFKAENYSVVGEPEVMKLAEEQ